MAAAGATVSSDARAKAQRGTASALAIGWGGAVARDAPTDAMSVRPATPRMAGVENGRTKKIGNAIALCTAQPMTGAMAKAQAGVRRRAMGRPTQVQIRSARAAPMAALSVEAMVLEFARLDVQQRACRRPAGRQAPAVGLNSH